MVRAHHRTLAKKGKKVKEKALNHVLIQAWLYISKFSKYKQKNAMHNHAMQHDKVKRQITMQVSNIHKGVLMYGVETINNQLIHLIQSNSSNPIRDQSTGTQKTIKLKVSFYQY